MEKQEKKNIEYDRMAAQQKLMCELDAGRTSGEEQGWVPAEKVREMFNR